MEHRYADESEPSWYTGRRHATDSGDPEVSGSFRLPEQREAAPEPDGRAAYEAVRMPVRGPEYPPVRPPATPPLSAPSPLSAPNPLSAPSPLSPPIAEPTSLVPPITAPRTDQTRPADGVYRTRRPISSIVLAVLVAVLLLPALRLLATATFAADPSAGGIVPAVCLTLGLALTGFGLFAAGGGPTTRDAWLRAPMAYLPAGLILLLAAGLAVA
ncbi:hypothetical protein [Actinoplanes sp. GCM10030250]|uniref:hypothetical protein n=1 Tax=Actinoplanes sp. GCM10030250 TaxID=3273376 RepID=UPI003606D421